VVAIFAGAAALVVVVAVLMISDETCWSSATLSRQLQFVCFNYRKTKLLLRDLLLLLLFSLVIEVLLYSARVFGNKLAKSKGMWR
ncbi:hypothetical protein MKW92_027845, partial [Papaver armeniacum]